jgi:hypothetical protein
MTSTGPPGHPGPAESMELRPLPAAGPAASYAFWGMDRCADDIMALGGFDRDEVAEWVARYQAQARLILDERGPGFTDSFGEWHPVPPSTARVVALNLDEAPHGTPGAMHRDQTKTLLFLDGAGRVVLTLPNYGWNATDLHRWVDACGWDSDLGYQTFAGDGVALLKTYPDIRRAPRAPVGQRVRQPESLARRIARRVKG